MTLHVCFVQNHVIAVSPLHSVPSTGWPLVIIKLKKQGNKDNPLSSEKTHKMQALFTSRTRGPKNIFSESHVVKLEKSCAFPRKIADDVCILDVRTNVSDLKVKLVANPCFAQNVWGQRDLMYLDKVYMESHKTSRNTVFLVEASTFSHAEAINDQHRDDPQRSAL